MVRIGPSMNIEMRHLRYFVAVAEEASFTAAAQRVHVNQQVLSTQIRQLEDAVGFELLRRTSRGVVLTAAGSAFLESARQTLASLDRGVAAARNAASAVSGQLAVGLQAQPAAGLLDRSSDVALLRPPVEAPGILLEQVGQEPRVFVLPAGHPLSSRPALELADVAGLPWVAAPLATDGCFPSRWRDDWLVVPRPGGDVPVIGAVASTIEEWREHIAAGRGISLCPASSEAFSARPDIVFVPAAGVMPTALCVAWRADDVRPEVLAFVKVATSEASGAEAAAGAEAASGAAEE